MKLDESSCSEESDACERDKSLIGKERREKKSIY
jgi:hypothetical protein